MQDPESLCDTVPTNNVQLPFI